MFRQLFSNVLPFVFLYHLLQDPLVLQRSFAIHPLFDTNKPGEKKQDIVLFSLDQLKKQYKSTKLMSKRLDYKLNKRSVLCRRSRLEIQIEI